MPTAKRQRQKEGRRARVEQLRRQQRRRQALKRTGTTVLGAAVVVGIVFLIVTGPSGKSTPPATTTTTTIPHTKAQVAAAQAAANQLAYRAGCSYQPPSAAHPANVFKWTKAPKVTTKANRTYYATIVTTQGTMRMWLNTLTAPINANNFIFLAEHHYYDCNAFFRVQPTYAVQAGSPNSSITATPGYDVANPEYAVPVQNPRQIQYPKGTVVMIPIGRTTTNGGQFAIVPQPLPLVAVSPAQFTIVGYVVGGRSAFETIAAEGASTKSGIPPLVLNRILRVTISSKHGKPTSPTGTEP